MKRVLPVFLVSMAMSMATANAAVVVTTSEAASFTVASDDLLQTAFGAHSGSPLDNRDGGSPADTTYLQSLTPSGEASLRDGVWFSNVDSRGSAITETGEFIEWTFDLASAPLGFEINQIDLYSNWGTLGGRDEIRTEISFSYVGSPGTFVPGLTPAAYNPPTETQGKLSITEDASGILATGVAGIRFDFPDQENGAVGYSEIDVIGSPVAIPEPGSLAVLLVGGLGVAARRRRRNA